MSRENIIKAKDYFGQASPVASPLTLSGCFLWLDAYDPLNTSIQPQDAISLPVWRDKSGNSYDLNAVGLAGEIPNWEENGLSGRPCVNITNSNRGYRASTSGLNKPVGPFTVFFAGDVTSQSFYFFDVSASTRFVIWVTNTAATGFYFQTAFQGTASPDLSGPRYLTWIFDQSTLPSAEKRDNGVSIDSDMAFQDCSFDATFSLGARFTGDTANNTNGKMSEVIIYDRRLTPQEILSVEKYLKIKWGL